MKKHIHCDVIKAMAEGKQIQVRSDSGRWVSLTAAVFRSDAEYRITPDDEVKHVHHDVMVAWAKGNEVQYTNPKGVGKEVWHDNPDPTFAYYLRYRVKPPVNKKDALMKEMEELLERMKKLECELCT